MPPKFTRRAFLAAACLLAGVLAGCAPRALPARSAVRVGTYNIRSVKAIDKRERSWNDRREDLVAVVRSLDCDVLGLQEVTCGQLEFLESRLPEYAFLGEFRGGSPETSEASPVCYRKSRFKVLRSGTFWLSETPDEKGSVGWDAKYPRILTYAVMKDRASGRRFTFANCHTDHKGAIARERGLRLAVERLKGICAGSPAVFVGDHNCRETDSAALAVSAAMTNALYASETPPRGPWRTFNGWEWRDQEVSIADALRLPPALRNSESGSPDGNRTAAGGYVHEDCGARIDYIYVSPGLRVIDYETRVGFRPRSKHYPSDHFPSVATLDLSAGGLCGAPHQ